MGSHRFLLLASLLLLNNNIYTQEIASTEPDLSVTIENENVTQISNVSEESSSIAPETVRATIYNENATQSSSVSEESLLIEDVTVPATIDNKNVTQSSNDNETQSLLSCVSSPTLGDLCVALNLTSSPLPCVNSHKADGVCVHRKNCDYGTPAIDISLYAPRAFIRPCQDIEVCCPVENILPDPVTENNEDDIFSFDDDY